jgi:hypothetical protein
MCFKNDSSSTKEAFRIDLPSSGSVDIYAAIGDADGGNNGYLEIFDNTSTVGTLVANQALSTLFRDATDTGYSAANWPASNAKATKIFTTTTMYAKVTPGASSGGNFVVAHLRVVQGGGGGGVVMPIFVNHLRTQGIM